MTQPQEHLVPESAVERAMVAHGWAEVDTAERLGPSGAARHMGARFAAERRRAGDWFSSPPFAINREAYESPANIVRFRKTCDYLNEGESVYEVGIGKGFLATMMMTEGKLGGYRGVDLVEANVTDTTTVLRENGFGDRADVGVQNLYDLTREDVERAGASLLVCCEVIEHVPDPERALQVLADALPDGTDLLWSVPLLGRLEGVWGHTAVFGAQRVQQMMRSAGLVAHHVEVVDNVWVFVLASRTPGPSPRAEAAVRALAVPTEEDLLEPPAAAITNVDPVDVPRRDSRWLRRVSVADAPVAPEQQERFPAAATVEITPEDPDGWYGGLALACPEGARGLRVQLDVSDLDRVSRVYVEASRAGEPTGRWTWQVDQHRPRAAQPTFLIRPGIAGTYLRRDRASSTVEGADQVDVFVKGTGPDPVRISLLRWAWVS